MHADDPYDRPAHTIPFPRWAPELGLDPDWLASDAVTLDRLTHLVFVDGLLLDAWSEPVRGTRWESVAESLDRRERAPRPQPPYAAALDWLAAVCGGPAAVERLTDEPLTDDRIDLPLDLLDRRSRQRLESAAELIDAVAAALFDAETSYACRRALLALWDDAPEVVLGAASAAHLVGGICWAVGKANGLYGPGGGRTQNAVREALALSGAISGPGQKVAVALRGLVAAAHRPYGVPGVPDLLPLGRTDVLLAATRKELIALRQRALRARALAEPVTCADSR